MKIESSEISISAQTEFKLEQKSSSEFTNTLYQTKLDIKDEIRKQNIVKAEVTKLEKVLLNSEKELTFQDKVRKNILETLFSNFTDKKDFKLIPKDDNALTNKPVLIKESTFTYTKEYFQESSIEFNTKAIVKTNRGEINIDLDISFSQSFTEVFKHEIKQKETIFLDPLIINYSSNLTSFDNIDSSIKFEFDLNSDGKNELIPELKNGAGFLALDKNENKKIDDGNELFGANTGDGFAELKAYDEDKNSWIDENDAIFSKLLIWEKNKEGKGSLITLGQAGIGAIYLSATDSKFTYASAVNENYALLKQTSFYLKENGKAGLVTSSDFAV